jgi:hypothetical protein
LIRTLDARLHVSIRRAGFKKAQAKAASTEKKIRSTSIRNWSKLEWLITT